MTTNQKPTTTSPDKVGPCDDCGKDAGIRVCTGCWERAKNRVREEQREADLRAVSGPDDPYWAAEAIRATPLTATLLGDRLKKTEARVEELEAALRALLDEHLSHLSESTYTEQARAVLAKYPEGR